MEVASGVADGLLHRRDERGHVVPLLGLELRDAIGIDGRALKGGQRLDRDAPDLRPTLAREQLDIQPALQSRCVTEDLRDLLRGVPGDHVRSFYRGDRCLLLSSRDRAPWRLPRRPGKHTRGVRGGDRARCGRRRARRAPDCRRRSRGASQRVPPGSATHVADLLGSRPSEPPRAATARNGPRSLRRQDRRRHRGQGSRLRSRGDRCGVEAFSARPAAVHVVRGVGYQHDQAPGSECAVRPAARAGPAEKPHAALSKGCPSISPSGVAPISSPSISGLRRCAAGAGGFPAPASSRRHRRVGFP